MSLHQATDSEPTSAAAFALAMQRTHEQDEARKAWLDQHCSRPDPDERDGLVILEPKDHPSDRCSVRCCNRAARAKGMCDRHYRLARRQGLTQAEFRAAARENAR